jgi:hypothetical protein
MPPLGRFLIILGLVLVVLDLVITYSGLFSFLRLGRFRVTS